MWTSVPGLAWGAGELGLLRPPYSSHILAQIVTGSQGPLVAALQTVLSMPSVILNPFPKHLPLNIFWRPPGCFFQSSLILRWFACAVQAGLELAIFPSVGMTGMGGACPFKILLNCIYLGEIPDAPDLETCFGGSLDSRHGIS